VQRRAFLKLLCSMAAGGTAVTLIEKRLQLRHQILHVLRPRGDELHQSSVVSMGTFVTITVHTEDLHRCPAAVDQALEEFRIVDALMSTFKPESDVSAVNRCAGGRSMEVDQKVCDVVAAAIAMGDRSGGLFDITVLPLLSAYGFRGKSPVLPDPDGLSEALSLVDYRQVSVDKRRKKVGIATRHAQIDLGGIAKGYAVDCAADVLRSHGVRRGVIDAGGDILALGAPLHAEGWTIGIQHPFRAGELAATVRIRDEAIATSGNYEKYISFEDKRYGHLMDTRTGRPSDSMLSASVIAPTALEADGLSTSVFPMGVADGLGFIGRQARAGGLFVTSGREGGIGLKATAAFPAVCVSGSV